MNIAKSMRLNFLLLIIGVIIAFFISEVVLGLFFGKQIRVIGNEIILATNQDYKFSNLKNPKLDKEIVHSKNSLGFRGLELDPDAKLKIITIGGSSTECFYLNEEDDWSLLLGKYFAEDGNDYWINNAGFSGHSTFGHLKLLQDHIVHLDPDIVIFNIGVNDLSLLRASSSDDIMLIENQHFLWKLMSKSKTLTLVKNIISNKQLGQYYISSSFSPVDLSDLDSIFVPIIDVGFTVDYHFLDAYADRILELIEICKKNEIKPVFVAQPTLYGCGYDIDSTIHLGSLKMENGDDVNGCIVYSSLESSKYVLKQIALQHNCLVIEMDTIFPKDIDYYYDFVHFSKLGSREFAKMLYEELNPIIGEYAQ